MTQLPIPTLVRALVDDLPTEAVQLLADQLDQEPALDWPRLLAQMRGAIPRLEAQERVRQFVEGWRGLAQPPSPPEMAQLLQTAAFTLDHQRKKQKLELLWTGPRPDLANLRRNDQALIELINTAKKQIIIVSFVVYKVQDILSALEKAALRGVEILVILESPEESAGKIAFGNIAALGAHLRDQVRIFIWPKANRKALPNGKKGALHVKCAVADGARLFLSSANLTESAMNLNMEMGILLEGKDLASQSKHLFTNLIADGILKEVHKY